MGNTQIVKELVLRVLEGKPKQQKKARRKIQEYAFSSAANFAEVLNSIAKFIEDKLSESMGLVTRLVEKAPPSIAGSRDLKVAEPVVRMFAILASQKKAEDSLVSPLERFLSGFRTEEENEIFFVFPHGPKGPMISYPVTEGREDEAVFRILSNMEGDEYGIALIPETGESIFAPVEDLERCFRFSLSEQSRIREKTSELVSLAKEAWQEIKEWRRYGIRSNGQDIVAIVDGDPIKKLNIKYLRFIQEAAPLPGVGIEIILDNQKIILAKVDSQGNLRVPWTGFYPEAALLLNVAIVLYLRDLTCGQEDTFIRLQRVKRKGIEELPSSPRAPRECLLPRREVEYIPRRHLSRYLPASGNDERIRRVSRKPRELWHRRWHVRTLPFGKKASEEAKKKAEEKGIKLLPDETFVKEFNKEEEEIVERKEMPEKVLRDVSAARELRELLGI